MSAHLIALLALAAPPVEGAEARAAVREVVAAADQMGPRTGAELRDAVRLALRRWARPSDVEADEAARELLVLYGELTADAALSNPQRLALLGKVGIRLEKLSEQISRRIDRAERPVRGAKPESVDLPGARAGTLAQQLGARAVGGGAAAGAGAGIGPARGGAGTPTADYGQELVDLIRAVIRPATWEANGGNGTISYWRPGHALVIRQTEDVHGHIGNALEQLRRAGR